MTGLRVAVDARPLDIPYLRAQGIGRYAHGLLGPLSAVAVERGGELVLMREGHGAPGSFAGSAVAGAHTRRLRRPPTPGRYADWPEQALLALDLRRSGASVAHFLSIYRSAVFPGVPHLVSLHDVVPLMWPDLYLRTGIMHRMLYRGARRARLLLTGSEAARRDCITHLGLAPERIVVVPDAADERFAPTDPRPVRTQLGLERPYLLWVGGLSAHDPRKNLPALIDTFAQWRRDQDRPETLVLAGGIGDEGRELQARARRTGAPVLFPGFVPDEDLPALMSGASCLVTPSRYEGFGLPALEAISCGTPVAAFDVGAVPEVAGPGGLYVADGDTAALLQACGRICDDTGLRLRLAEEGRAHAGHFSWRRTAELTWQAYERVGSRGR